MPPVKQSMTAIVAALQMGTSPLGTAATLETILSFEDAITSRGGR